VTGGTAQRAIAWLTPAQAGFVCDALAAARLELVGAGTPGQGRSSAAATALDVEPRDDLRTDLLEAEVDLILIASPGPFGADDASDLSAIAAASARGVRVVALEPIPADARMIGEPTHQITDSITMAPLFRYAPAVRAVREVLDQFGHVRSAALHTTCGARHVSLGALIFDTFDMLVALLGEPDSIDAAYVSTGQGDGIHALPGESLRNLGGELNAVVRYPDGRSAIIALSDQAGVWSRRAVLTGPAGQLTLHDDGFEWVRPDGSVADRTEIRATGDPAAHALGDALIRLLDPALGPQKPADVRTTLAMAQVALLSARTGQGESMSTILRMLETA